MTQTYFLGFLGWNPTQVTWVLSTIHEVHRSIWSLPYIVFHQGPFLFAPAQWSPSMMALQCRTCLTPSPMLSYITSANRDSLLSSRPGGKPSCSSCSPTLGTSGEIKLQMVLVYFSLHYMSSHSRDDFVRRKKLQGEFVKKCLGFLNTMILNKVNCF